MIQVQKHIGREYMAERPVSPESTAGAGTFFELRVGAIVLSRMIRGGVVPVGPQLGISEAGFQQRNAGYKLDDIVIHSQPRDGETAAPVTQVQVKKNLALTAGNEAFSQFIDASVRAYRDCPEEFENGHRLLCLAAEESSDKLLEFRQLCERARGTGEANSLQCQIQPNALGKAQRDVYGHVRSAIGAASGSSNESVIDRLTYQILASMHVWAVAPWDDGRDWRNELDLIGAIASDAGVPSADMLGKLRDLSESFAKNGGKVASAHVQRRLRSDHGLTIKLTSQRPESRAPKFIANQYGSGTMNNAVDQTNHFHLPPQ